MSKYYCEGTVRQVKFVNGVARFTIEPSAPYIYEKEQAVDGGKRVDRWLLMADSLDIPQNVRLFRAVDFTIPSPADFNSLLIAKANKLKIRVVVELSDDPKQTVPDCLDVNQFEVL